MKTTCCKFLLIALLFAFAGCMNDADKGFEIFSETYDFSASSYDWTAGFSDFPVRDSSSFELNSAYTQDPSSGGKALMITGNNQSGDLFMYFKKQLKGFRPDTEYTLTFEVEFSSESTASGNVVPSGENVFFKVGATGQEPKSVIDANYYVMNIDKGDQNSGGQDMIYIGNISGPVNSSGYTTVSRSNTENYDTPCLVRTNSKGELWLIMGTDSGYQGITTLFYSKVSVVFSVSK